MNDLNLDIIKELIAKKYEYADFIFREVLPNPTPIAIRCSIPQLTQVSDTFSHEEQVYNFLIKTMYHELIVGTLKNHEKETKAWFSTKFPEFSFSEIIRKTLLALNEGDYKYIILPNSVYNIFLSSEMDVYTNILHEGNFNQTKIKFNSIVPPFFKDKKYDHINAYFINEVNDIYLLSNEIFDIRKSTLYQLAQDPTITGRGIGISIKLNANFIHKIQMYENDQVLTNHLKLKKVKNLN